VAVAVAVAGAAVAVAVDLVVAAVVAVVAGSMAGPLREAFPAAGGRLLRHDRPVEAVAVEAPVQQTAVLPPRTAVRRSALLALQRVETGLRSSRAIARPLQQARVPERDLPSPAVRRELELARVPVQPLV
jgi:hypothetical protein